MSNAIFQVPIAINEPVRQYPPSAKETKSLLSTYEKMLNGAPIDMPMYIGGEEIRTDNKKPMSPPHDHQAVLGHFSSGDASHVNQAIDAAMSARSEWANLPWEERAAIFLRAADLLAGPFRDRMNASTMLAQSKNVFQAEIDAACELIDFFRFNVQYMTQIYKEQPESLPGLWNRLEYRPLEGFVFAITPFNFTSICANLCAAPAMMGNVVVWKPAESQMYSAKIIMDLFKEAGVPDGVINLISVDGPVAGEVVFNHKDFAGLHFTGSTSVFRHLWKEIGVNIAKYRSYPRIVGETGGKDFVMVHKTADAAQVATALTRGS
ncbi:MAG: aldehyde dehydrogenase family protein, partial [Crocinitomicaceae bacterium]|nr:aldehyde dehydrogenase family protein [Crocinitomicaceae bacterium]